VIGGRGLVNVSPYILLKIKILKSLCRQLPPNPSTWLRHYKERMIVLKEEVPLNIVEKRMNGRIQFRSI